MHQISLASSSLSVIAPLKRSVDKYIAEKFMVNCHLTPEFRRSLFPQSQTSLQPVGSILSTPLNERTSKVLALCFPTS